MQEIMIQYLAATLGKSVEDIAAIVYKKADDGTQTDQISETALSDLEALHAEKVKGSTDEAALKAEYNKGHQAGKFEALSKAEEEIKKQYNVEGRKLSDIVGNAVKAATSAEATEDKIKIHPLYISEVNRLTEAAEAQKAEFEAKLKAIEAEAGRKERFTKVMPRIDEALAKAGVDLATVAPMAKRAFLDSLGGFDFEESQTGIYLKDGTGALLKDKHGNPQKIEAHVADQAAQWFIITKQPPRGAPGNDPAPPAPPSKWTLDNVPASMEEFSAAYAKIADPAEQAQFAALFEQKNRQR